MYKYEKHNIKIFYIKIQYLIIFNFSMEVNILKTEYSSSLLSERSTQRSYLRNLPYDCHNCGYMGKPSSSGAMCETCILKSAKIKKSNKSGA